MSRYCKTQNCERYFFVLIYTVFIYGTMQIFFIWEYFRYRNSINASELQFANDNLFFFTLGLFYGAYLLVSQCITKKCTQVITTLDSKFIDINKKEVTLKDNNGKITQPFGGPGWVLVRTGLCFFINFVIQQLFGYLTTITFVVSQSELYFHAIFGGMTEEEFFRGFIQQSIYDVLYEYIFKKKSKIGAAVISISVSTISFGISHFARYGANPVLLVSTFFIGLNYAIIYFLADGDVIETMIVHGINNWIAIDLYWKSTHLITSGYSVSNLSALLIVILVGILCLYITTKLKDKITRRKYTISLIMPLISILLYIIGMIFSAFLIYTMAIFSLSINCIRYLIIKKDEMLKKELFLIAFVFIVLGIVLIYYTLDYGIIIILT